MTSIPAQIIAPQVALLLEQLAFDRRTTVVDVGANPLNEAPYTALLQAGGCNVVGFEPQAPAFERLQQSKTDRETYFPHAVGDGQTKRLRIYEAQGMTSIFPPDAASMAVIGKPRWSKVISEVDMLTVALDDLPDLPPFDALKIDIQGGETLVFNSAKRVLATAVCVIVELRYLRLYHGEPMLHGVDAALREQGFELHKFLSNKSSPLANSQLARLNRRRVADQLIDGDGVYIRDLSRLAAYTVSQLNHLALLAASVINSHSLALFALDELVRRGAASPDLPGAYVDALPQMLRREDAP